MKWWSKWWLPLLAQMTECKGTGVDLVDSAPNGGIRLALAGALSNSLLRPLIEVAGNYAAEFICAYFHWHRLFPMQLLPAIEGATVSVPLPNVGRCSRTRTIYVLCALHATLTFRCPNPDGTVRKVTVNGVKYLLEKHAESCCQMAETKPKSLAACDRSSAPSDNTCEMSLPDLLSVWCPIFLVGWLVGPKVNKKKNLKRMAGFVLAEDVGG
jgi:hypothetical protein